MIKNAVLTKVAAKYECLRWFSNINLHSYFRFSLLPILYTKKWNFIFRDKESLELLKLSKDFICRNFLSVIRNNEELLFAQEKDILSFISSDELNIFNEENVWEFVVNWVSLCERERKRYIGKLLSHIRIGLMRYDYFNKKVSLCMIIKRKTSISIIYFNRIFSFFPPFFSLFLSVDKKS